MTWEATSATTLRLARLGAAAVAALAVTYSAVPQAGADELTDQRDRVNTQLAEASAHVDEFSSELTSAAVALQRSEGELSAARQALAQAQAQRAAAQAEDDRLAGELQAARRKLAEARKAVAANQRKVAAEARLIGASVRETHQQNTELMGIAAFVTDVNTGDVNQTMQWSSTIFNATQAQMDRLQTLQLKLEESKRALTKAEAEVAGQRAAAAEQLQLSRGVEGQADQAAAAVAQQVSAHQQAKAAVAGRLAAEKRRQASLDGESRSVEKRIAARIAAQKAAAAKAAAEAAAQARARQIAAEKARAQAAKARALAAARAREAAQAAQQRHADAAAKAAQARRAAAAAERADEAVRTTRAVARVATRRVATTSGWSAPVAGPITSSYGMRLHPVLHYWKLHDGTDFGAPCGAPIRAPRDGVVTESYYNAGYGNRLLLDHGQVNGSYTTTAYNHATHYVVGVGQHVSRGQVIGYVGSTGYSTGCHLHLMMWKDGTMVNPAANGF